MVDYTGPTSWIPPHWHHDYGDVQLELDHLRHVAQRVIEQLPQLSVGLSVPEDGVMFLVITNNDSEKVLAEIYSIDSNGGDRQRKYGIFLRPNSAAEEEQYSPSTERVIDLLNSVANERDGTGLQAATWLLSPGDI
jgi:hypothetical protein